MIEVRQLAKSFAAPAQRGRLARRPRRRARARRAGARVHAVRDVSFDAPDGRITGLLGPNGAGKTTTLRMLAALITPDAGPHARRRHRRGDRGRARRWRAWACCPMRAACTRA